MPDDSSLPVTLVAVDSLGGWFGALIAAAAVGFATWNAWRHRHAAMKQLQARRAAEDRERAAVEQARKATAEAAAANRAKDDFLATMGHEIRTPLNGVIGTTDLMLDTVLTAQQHEYLATIRESAESLLAIVNDLLDFSRLEAGAIVLEHALFDLRRPLVDVVRIAEARIDPTRVELVLDFGPDVPTSVYGDAGRLRQVLLQLVSNAAKFTMSGHVAVRVEKLARDAAPLHAWLRFAVADTGVGIAPELHARIFEEFELADASSTRRHGGAGLGLPIARKLVELMGGEMGVQSEPGRGSVFWFSIPLQLDQLPPSAPSGTAGRVLIVDDLEPAAQALKSLLASVHRASQIATSASEGLELLRAAAGTGQPFEFVAVDQSIADADSGAFFKTVSALPEGHALKLIWMGTPLRGDSGSPLELPAGVVRLAKPVLEPESLLEALREAQAAVAVEPPSEPVRLSRQGLRVLVAEDNPVNRAVAAGMLKKLGCEVDFAEHGAEAVRKVRLNAYDMILMDCRMPEMDGWDATREIRRRDSRTPIVAVTANATAEDRSRCLQAGMNDYLNKPLRLPDLVRVMERWVG